MKMTLHQVRLPLKHPFTIARGTLTSQPSLIVELEQDGIRGYGEVTENSFYGHTFNSMTQSLMCIGALLNDSAHRSPMERWALLHAVIGKDRFALSAIDIATHDLRGKQLEIPTWQDWGLEWKDIPDSSFTIGIDTIDAMISKLKEEPGWSIYKIKLGTAHDLEIVSELRRHTTARFRVDANCGWTAQQAIANSLVLAGLGVEFIEQPLPIHASREDKLKVFHRSALPVIADEDCQKEQDVDACYGLYHGINVKICKCGGLTPALSMLQRARSLGMKTMVGCMVESSIGISGAAQLLPLLDFADLDGAVLLRDEPASGVRLSKGVVHLSRLPGCGSSLDRELLPKYLIETG